MKPMVYRQGQKSAHTLCHDTYKGYEFAIVSLGTHPCAYIGIPKRHRYYKKDYFREIFYNLPVHWGLTYSDIGAHKLMLDKWVIGWDYGHHVDYIAGVNLNGKKWTTEEILEEVKAVIDEIVKEEG